MAFNPFHSFRKHNKVVFAGLTILCMVTFVLSAGGGGFDFFQQLTAWVGMSSSRTDYVSLYDKNYSVRDIGDLAYRRRMANDYMDNAIAVARQGLEQRLAEIASKIEPESGGPFGMGLRMQRTCLMMGYIAGIQEAYQDTQFQIQQAEAQKKTELANALGGLKRLLDLDYTLLVNRQPKERFFGPTDSDDDTINFLIWRHQADQNGVRLTDNDITKMIAEITRGELVEQDAGNLERMMQDRFKGAYTVEALYAALGDEFRVRIAQLALTGSMSGIGQHTLTAAPIELTPQESWNLFKDARTAVRVGLIDIPVKDFVAEVETSPSEDVLKKLFDKYKADEPAPDRDVPGFKEPRKIQVEWVSAAPDLPYYGKVADEVLAVAPALRLLGDTSPAAQLLMPVQLDAELLEKERSFRLEEPSWTNPLPQIHQSSALRAEVAATLVGSSLGAAATGAPAVPSGLLAMETRVLTQEAKDRATIGLGMIGLAASPDPLAVFGAPMAAMPRVTLEQVRRQLLDKAKAELITGGRDNRMDPQNTTQHGLIATDLYVLRGEVMKLGREKGKEAVEKYVADFVKERGLQHGQSDKPRDQYDLSDDPGLVALKDAYRKAHGQDDLLLRRFPSEFFADQSQTGAPDGMFIPHKYLSDTRDDRQYLWWRTDDQPPKTPKFESARSRVEDAWKLIEARELAKKEADRILEAVKKTQRDAANLRDIAEQNGKRDYFDLGPFALYQQQIKPNAAGGLGRDYASVVLPPPMTPDNLARVYNISADRIAYPDAAMILNLLNLRKELKGATTIVSDRPKQNFYVATLLSRDEPSQDDFRRAYQGSMAQARDGDSLLYLLTRNRPEEYRKAVLEQLRKEAKVVIKDNAKQKPADQ
jgi:hypothetical protein